jgi:hypothetical protein
MRRVLLAVTVGGLLMTAAACSDEPDPVAAPPSAEAPTAAAEPSAVAYPDTVPVCTDVGEILTGDMAGVGAELGRMIARREAKAAADAAKAQAAAKKQLQGVAEKVRKTTAGAQDPGLVAAGDMAADNIAATAGEAAFWSKIKTIEDVDRAIKAEMPVWRAPLTATCGD